MPNARVTVTLPSEIVRAIDREELNRSHFVLKAVTHELGRRRAEQLRESLHHPHPESLEMTEVGLSAWAEEISEDTSDLIAPGTGEEIRWSTDQGWVGVEE